MEATTKEVALPLTGAKAVIKDWITGADAEYIQSAIHAGLKVKPSLGHGSAVADNFDTSVILNQLHRSLEKYVVSIDGISEGVVEKARSLPEEDYDFLVNEVQSRMMKKKVPSQSPATT